MKKKVAIKYAKKFAECHSTDKSYIDNNTTMGLLTAMQEEMGELIAAIGKYKRTLGEGPITYTTTEDATTSIKEELSDVLSTGILLAQKEDWLEECLDRHKEKSILCSKRIEDKRSKNGYYEIERPKKQILMQDGYKADQTKWSVQTDAVKIPYTKPIDMSPISPEDMDNLSKLYDIKNIIDIEKEKDDDD